MAAALWQCRRPAAAAAAALVAALAACLLPPAQAQMTTPLQGSGSPGPNTTDVYLSVYLDRLLNGACERKGGRGALCPHAACRMPQARVAMLLACALHSQRCPPSFLARGAVNDIDYRWQVQLDRLGRMAGRLGSACFGCTSTACRPAHSPNRNLL